MSMTAKERTKMVRLETENRIFREEMSRHMRIYGDTLAQLVELKAKLELIDLAMRGDAE